MNIPGIYSIYEPGRHYPAGKNGANLIGYVGIDNSGLLGLEHSLEKHLSGTSHKIIYRRDARGNNIVNNHLFAAPESQGAKVTLTIDQAIQEIAAEALSNGIRKSKAARGFALVVDPHTGKILAMANHPTFDPNNRRSLRRDNTSNLSVSLLLEPGSVIKPLVIAAALDTKQTFSNNFDNLYMASACVLAPMLV